MHKLLVVGLLIIIVSPINAFAGDAWTKRDIAMEAAYQTLSIIDWGQTRYIAKHPQKYYETNPILGQHPSVDRVDKYFVASLLVHYLISDTLPSKYREIYQATTVLFEMNYPLHNYHIGIKVSF